MSTPSPRSARRSTGRGVAAVVALIVALSTVLGPTAPASAHTSLFQASPGPGQKVGGTLDFVDLAFLDVVSQAKVLVTHNGVAVPGATTADSGIIIRFVFDQPVTDGGRYDVSYSWLASDGHPTEEAYAFTYQAQQPPAFHIGQPGGPPANPSVATRSWLRIGAFAVLITALAGLALLFLLQVQSRRSAEAAGSGPRRPGPGR